MKRLLYSVLACLVAAGPAAAVGDDDVRISPVVLAYRKARPSIVNISAKSVVRSALGFSGGDPFEDIFPLPMLRDVPVQSLGSGIIIHPAGYIVTNAHVVRRAQEITVTLQKDVQAPARVISSEPQHDLAVLKVEAPPGVTLQPLALGRSDDLMAGETVVAIGNPFGYSNTVTTGVVSALDRKLSFRGGVEYEGLIQIDAPINPGNSGGPLLNVKGELIGINSAIRADAQNIGFSVPVDLLTRQLPSLLDFERINRVIFGASVVQRHGEKADVLAVAAVRPGSPAEQAGLLVNDALEALDGQPLRQITDFVCPMLDRKAGEKVAITVLRAGKEVRLTVELKARPSPDGKALARAMMGMSLRTITPELVKSQGLSIDRGLLVTGLEAGGPADRLGIRLKDAVFQLGQLYVKDLDDVGAVLEDAHAGDVIKIGISRGNIAVWAQIEVRPPTSRPSTQRAE